VLVAVISDTHLPKGSRELPSRCVELIAEAEAVIHAGDFATLGVLRDLQAIGPAVYAVHGNVDEPALQRELPRTLRIELAGRSLGVIHDAGPVKGRIDRLEALFPDADAAIYGHTHAPHHEQRGPFQVFNPGSPTERRRSPSRAMGIMRVGRCGVAFEHVRL
jgi:uncharacterized protein